MKKILFALLFIPITFAYSSCAVYFTGIGCPHCARADPVVIGEALKNPEFVVVEYEVYHDSNYNAQIFSQYSEKYGIELGVPNILFEEGNLIGDRDIIENLNYSIRPSRCPLLTGYEDFSELNLSSLPGRPKVWLNDMVLIRIPNEVSNEEQVKMVIDRNFNGFEEVTPQPVPLSGRNVYFKHAVKIQGWLVEYEHTDKKSIDYRIIGLGLMFVIFLIFIIKNRKR